MKVGISATRYGLTDAQCETLTHVLLHLAPRELHHGDCIGGDENAHNIATALKIKTVAHPPSNAKARAWCLADLTLPPKPYLERNSIIVAVTDALIALPKTRNEELRSGTWATVREARRKRKPIEIIWLDGAVTLEEPYK